MAASSASQTPPSNAVAAQAIARMPDSAGKMTDKTEGAADSARYRTALAADRTIFAAERTYAAWVRTGLAALASGVGAKALLTGVLPDLGVKLAGTVLTLFSAFCFAAAVWREFSTLPKIVPDARRIPGPVLYTVNAFLALVALMAVASIWMR